MKRIIYTALALIVCASVFGIADYYHAKKKGTLVDFTDEDKQVPTVTEKKITPAVTTKEVTIVSDKEIKKEPGLKKKTNKNRSLLAKKEVEPELVKIETVKEPVTDKVDPLTIVPESKGTDPTDSLQVERRSIRMEMFSRAPIRTKKLKKN